MMQYVNILQVLYIGLVTPSVTRRSNRTDLLNEFLIQCIQLNLFIFTSWVPEPEIQYTYGWIMIVELYIFLVINGMIIIYDAFSIVVLIYYKYSLQVHRKYEIYREKKIQAPVLKRWEEMSPFIFDGTDLNIFKLDPLYIRREWMVIEEQQKRDMILVKI
jgi:hypothetical protein